MPLDFTVMSIKPRLIILSIQFASFQVSIQFYTALSSGGETFGGFNPSTISNGTLEFAHNLLREFKLGRSAVQETINIIEACGEASSSERTTRRWFQKFKVGDFGLEDQDGRGRRSTFKNEDLKSHIESNNTQTVCESFSKYSSLAPMQDFIRENQLSKHLYQSSSGMEFTALIKACSASSLVSNLSLSTIIFGNKKGHKVLGLVNMVDEVTNWTPDLAKKTNVWAEVCGLALPWLTTNNSDPTKEIELVRFLLREDRRITYQQLGKGVGFGSAAINTIINDHFKYRKLVSRWTPYSLT
ncbi:hypothetical protein LAZ67_21002551 [Cordylochernes scorpioides]|uniref:Mos1 transposase HTH domain-containing protein n=1 Tax=Cordylochernes scorpioides TaxID=51811 RepID=A0ABY6LSK9_9ARAC|nr:hypothetical protein LAZ67_21002551 [Cordylochernes scorpioides]